MAPPDTATYKYIHLCDLIGMCTAWPVALIPVVYCRSMKFVSGSSGYPLGPRLPALVERLCYTNHFLVKYFCACGLDFVIYFDCAIFVQVGGLNIRTAIHLFPVYAAHQTIFLFFLQRVDHLLKQDCYNEALALAWSFHEGKAKAVVGKLDDADNRIYFLKSREKDYRYTHCTSMVL